MLCYYAVTNHSSISKYPLLPINNMVSVQQHGTYKLSFCCPILESSNFQVRFIITEHPIVPLGKTWISAYSKCLPKKANNRLILNVKVKDIDFNFYKGISYRIMNELLGSWSIMINLSELGEVYIVCGKTDMRRGIDSLAFIVKGQF